LLTAWDGRLKLCGSDLEITSMSSAAAKVSTPGSTTINAKVFSEIVKELPDGEVQLKLGEGERLEIKAKSSRWRMVGVSAEEYPNMPGLSFEAKNKISAAQLLEMVNKTVYAVSTDESRTNLVGVCFELAGEVAANAAASVKSKKDTRELRMVATDGHRLAMINRPVTGLAFAESVIVPRKGLAEVRKILEAQQERDVGIDIIDGFLVLEGSNAKISVRLIDAQFPDYQQVMPKGEGVKATIKGSELSQALRRVALMVTDKGKCVKLDFSRDALRISSSSPELGDANEEIVVNYPGEPLTVGFNARYLLDFVAVAGEDQNITVELHGELGPCRLFCESDDSCCGIVMPMRLG